jgi:tetratricopeptide (TPR) repeat protein
MFMMFARSFGLAVCVSSTVFIGACGPKPVSTPPAHISTLPSHPLSTADTRKLVYYSDIGNCNKALKLNPNDPDALSCIAMDFMSSNPGKAVVLWEKVIKLQPDNNQALVFLGKALLKNGKKADAISVWKKAATKEDIWGSQAQKQLDKLGGH